MHQAEEEGDDPSQVRAAQPEVLQRHVGDAEGDAGLDQAARQLHHLERRQNQRDAVGQCERGDDLDQIDQPASDHDQGQQKHDVIVAQEDVFHPERGELHRVLPEAHLLAHHEEPAGLLPGEHGLQRRLLRPGQADHGLVVVTEPFGEVQAQLHFGRGFGQRRHVLEAQEDIAFFVYVGPGPRLGPVHRLPIRQQSTVGFHECGHRP